MSYFAIPPYLQNNVSPGETKKEFLENGADHAMQKHGMHAEDIYLNDIPANLLCHSFTEES
jgi:hypothetical protein